MKTRPTTAALGGAIAMTLAAGTLQAAPVSLTVDPAQSSIDMTIEVDISVASDSDTQSSTLSGNMEIEIDDAGNPTQITLTDMMIMIDQTLGYNWSFGFFGSADATLSNMSLAYATPGVPVGPTPVTDGSFLFPAVPISLGGLMDVNYNILLAGSGSQLIDLNAQDPTTSAFGGDLTIANDILTVTTSIPLDSVQPILDENGNEVGTVTITGSAVVVATGDLPACPADLNGDGLLNFFDVSEFLAAFTAQDPIADLNGDEMYNFFDVSEFLAAFAAGCP